VATPIVNKTAFSNVEVLVPALPVQQRIGGILAAYDDLIENNTRRIKILEEMARMIYREWFVNFRFPGHEKVKMVESETGIIPEGWEMRTLPNLCSKVIDGTHDSPLRVSQGYPLVTGKHFTDGFIHFDECYFISPEEHEKVMQRSKPEKGDILFSNIGTLGSIAMVPDQPKFSIKNVALFKPRKAIYSGFLYLHFVLPETLTELQAKASGTSQRFFSLEFLRGLKLVTPPDEILDRFDCCTKPILEERLLLNEAIRNLRHTRDLLLPKLISGEINVENFETETVAQGV
jgi:type I restriction enzyme S subunit